MRYIGIDPASKTGFVALDENGSVLVAKELTGVGSKDPGRIGTLVDEIMAHIQPFDIVAIEGFSYGSKGQGVSFQYGLGYMIRDRLWRRKQCVIEVAPAQVKKFACGKGNAAKEELVEPIMWQFGYEHKSNNVLDAYVMARMAEMVDRVSSNGQLSFSPTKSQIEVAKVILYPVEKAKKNKKKTVQHPSEGTRAKKADLIQKTVDLMNYKG